MNIEVPQEHYEYFFFGIKRGGNHAVINWILEHYDSYIHYNNCFLLNDLIYVEYKEDVIKKGKDPYQIHLLSFEDRPLILEKKLNSNIKDVSKLKSSKNIILLRDAYNTYASRYMKKLNPSPNMICWNDLWTEYNDPNIWIGFAKEFLQITNYLNDPIKINFNYWFSKKKYRQEISAILGREHTDKALERVSNQGGGSSFDYQNYDNQAQKMKLSKRYKIFVNNNDFIKNIILNKEIEKLNKLIFNFSIKNKFF